ncbi:MAG: right-handed parallel beta-helix repeat-containing protein [candidate division Zixibacteria bacterium]|nr:right-handed parallel beta-helix repeat-containing protein [candidate division Zixibacteria bacterium]MBU1471228.1 right-handed parallel beta-helix repeat-containing protein [candidate division Zixibacteria bacterium]MBU2624930.1 right-handed parallel beta-helix repeat-containing protein [candidate division Zixibacteria bacterium]
MKTVFVLFALLAAVQVCSADVIVVPTDYPTIQKAINVAQPGDEVHVGWDTYYENIVIDKAIWLVGDGGWRRPTIDGSGGLYVINIASQGVTVTGFIIRNAFCGVDCAISDTIKDNEFLQNTRGICLDGSSNYIQRNMLSYNDVGIFLGGGSSGNVINSNSIEMCDYGIVIEPYAVSNSITENTISFASVYGLHVMPEATDNQIFHNDFLSNGESAIDEGDNTWDDGYPSGGNYWLGYTGEDGDDDGIGDVPYSIPGGDNSDPYPLMIRHNHRCGDADYSWQVDIDDVVYLIAYIFTGGDALYPGACIGDADGSGGTDIDDVVYVLFYIFTNGAAPTADCCNPPW